MKSRTLIILLLILVYSPGCSNFSIERQLYDANQSIQKEQCRKDPTYTCPDFESYEVYQKKRKELNTQKD